MNRFLLTFFCFAVASFLKVSATDHAHDYATMYENTNKDSKIHKVSTAALSSGDILDEREIEKVALSGDYVAQYLLAQLAGSRARSVYNGERAAFLREKAMFLLISAIKGGYWKSIDEVNEVLSTQLSEQTCENFSSLQSLADLIYKDL